MPKISDERRAERRQQILNAAWTCFQREGLHVTTMDDIIRQSALSAGAVYSYFKNKDDLILAAVTTSLSGLGALVTPLFARDPLPPPDEFVRDVARAIEAFTSRDGFDLKRIALLGWSEAQRNEKLRETMRVVYTGFRQQLAGAVKTWQQRGLIAPTHAHDDAAKALLSLVVGYVVQATLMGDLAPEAIGRGLKDLTSAKA